MALWGVLAKVGMGAVNLLFGTSLGGGGGAGSAADISKIADKILPMSEREKTSAASEELEDARAYQPANLPTANMITQAGLLPFLLSWILAAINSVVDAANHAIRPFGFIWLCGGLGGWWKLPDPGLVDEFWQRAFWVVLTFFYGGRTIVKDLPLLIKAFKK